MGKGEPNETWEIFIRELSLVGLKSCWGLEHGHITGLRVLFYFPDNFGPSCRLQKADRFSL